MRVALVSNFDLAESGGVQVAVCGLAHYLRRLGHTVLVIANSSVADARVGVDLLGNAFCRLRLSVPHYRGNGHDQSHASALAALAVGVPTASTQFIRFLRCLCRYRPDIVNLHYLGESRAFCLAATQLCGFRFVISLHGEDIEAHSNRSRIGRRLSAQCLIAADRVLSNSRDLLLKAQAICPAIEGKSAVIGNGVEIEDFGKAAPYRHARPYVLSIGRLVDKKGFEVLVRAFRDVHSDWPDVDLIIVGAGPEQSALARLIADLGLRDSVVLFGQRARSVIPSLLAGSTVFVLPSKREPFGIVLLEAMAAKKPIVATNTGGVPEILSHMHSGILVPPGSPRALADAVSLLLGNERLRAALAEAGFRAVQEGYGWAQIAQKYLDNLTPIVGSSP